MQLVDIQLIPRNPSCFLVYRGIHQRQASANSWDPNNIQLGLYFGMPVMHRRKARALFEFILTKVKRHLSGWKKRTLFGAARDILIRSVAVMIPSYAVQTIQLLVDMLKELERLNKKFFWGDDEHQKKMYTVALGIICSDKKEDGLGLKNLKHMNYALLEKLARRIFSPPTSLWANLLWKK